MQTLGWIGLGQMGTPMASNLLNAGYKVNVYNRSSEKTVSLVELGATKCSSPGQVAAESEIIFLMLSDASAIGTVLQQENGVLESMTKGKIVVNMSTISPQEALEFDTLVAEKGGKYIDAPVSGSVGAAVTKQLLILAGGDAETLSVCQPYLDVLGKETIHFGKTSMGNAAKLTINMLLGIMMQGFGEAMLFGETLGLEKEQIAALISKSAMNNGLFQAKKESYLTEQFPPAFMLQLMSKDLNLISTAVKAAGAVFPLADAATNTFHDAKASGKAALDMAAVYLELKENNR